MRSSTTTQDSPSALAEGAQRTAEVTRDGDETSNVRENTISFAHVARTPEDRDESASDVQASDQDEFGGERGGTTGDEPGASTGTGDTRHGGKRGGDGDASQPANRAERAGAGGRGRRYVGRWSTASRCRPRIAGRSRRGPRGGLPRGVTDGFGCGRAPITPTG